MHVPTHWCSEFQDLAVSLGPANRAVQGQASTWGRPQALCYLLASVLTLVSRGQLRLSDADLLRAASAMGECQ